MYAISFDLNTTTLEQLYHNTSWQNAYSNIRAVLGEFGFNRQQGSVYFGDETVDAVRCVLAVQELARRHSWFTPSVTDIRMLRIEDNNDLMPAIEGLQAPPNR
ncbi:MAG: virulence factor [Alphaproteobacteria bacterium]